MEKNKVSKVSRKAEPEWIKLGTKTLRNFNNAKSAKILNDLDIECQLVGIDFKFSSAKGIDMQKIKKVSAKMHKLLLGKLKNGEIVKSLGSFTIEKR